MSGAGICMVKIGAITLTVCWLLWPSKQQVLCCAVLCMTFNIAAVSIVPVATLMPAVTVCRASTAWVGLKTRLVRTLQQVLHVRLVS